jgi:hypothetical protein
MAKARMVPQSETSADRPTHGHAPWSGPLFVIGVWRSGTSLVYALLNKHPQIRLMYEADLFLLRPLFSVPGAESRWLARWEFLNGALKRHRLGPQRISLTITNLPTAMETTYREYARQKGALIWGEKSPHLLRYPLSRLARDFPSARFIFIWRDPADICRSIVRAGNEEKTFFGRRGMTLQALLNCKRLKVECDELVSRGAAVHQIYYETLVKDPAIVMLDVCRFLNVPFIPAVASLEGADRSAIYEGKHHSLVKSESIVSSLDRPEVLPADLKGKIERYISLWREESGGKWPVLTLAQNVDSGKPSILERLLDRVLDRCLWTYDSIMLFIYCFAPFWFLRGIRAARTEHSSRGRLPHLLQCIVRCYLDKHQSDDTVQSLSDTN